MWFRACSRYNPLNFSRIVFIYEYRFEMSGDDQRTRVWKHRGQRWDTRLIITRRTTRHSRIMVLGVISFDSKLISSCHPWLTYNTQYVNVILVFAVLPFLSRNTDDFSRIILVCTLQSFLCLRGVEQFPGQICLSLSNRERLKTYE